MKKLYISFALISLVIGMTVFFYDSYFFLQYGEDVNDVEFMQGKEIYEWSTGERPFFYIFPAWVYAIIFWMLAFAFFALARTVSRKSSSSH